MRIAGSLPFLPHRLMVSDETRNKDATSRIVNRSGRSASDTLGSSVDLYDMERIIMIHFVIVNTRAKHCNAQVVKSNDVLFDFIVPKNFHKKQMSLKCYF